MAPVAPPPAAATGLTEADLDAYAANLSQERAQLDAYRARLAKTAKRLEAALKSAAARSTPPAQPRHPVTTAVPQAPRKPVAKPAPRPAPKPAPKPHSNTKGS